MIPKIIHYCWFGNSKKPKSVIKNIKTWTKYCPDYKIIEWNENNFDISINNYVEEAYAAKKWAFVTDYVRLYALYNYGGIYMDTDVEVVSNFDFVLENDAFSGYESGNYPLTATMGSIKNNKIIKEFLDYYNNKHFIKEDGTFDQTTNVIIFTNILKKHGIKCDGSMQTIDGFKVYPFEYFCAKDYNTGKVTLTENTYTIHNFGASWMSKNTRGENKLRHFLNRFISEQASKKISKNIYGIKRHGLLSAIKLKLNNK